MFKISNLKTIFFSCWFIVYGLLFVILPAAAQPSFNQRMEEFRQITEYSQTDLVTVVARIIRLVLSFQGLILTLIIILAGFRWMLSGGDEEKIKQAKAMIWSGVVGITIVFLSWTIAAFLMNNLFQVIR